MATIYGNRWEIVKDLPEGGQAHTFLVKDIKSDERKLYVLKRLKNVDRLERFKREIETVQSLSHTNIVQLIDSDIESKQPYLVTEYCEGGSLANADPYWKGSPIKAIEVFQQICQGVAYAHSKGIIHRDLKPENIFLRNKTGPAVVGDFGICYLEDDGLRLTLTEEAVGPRLYMAPELEDSRINKVSDKSDTYSLGKLLYWLISGKIFSREKYREPNWDLKGQTANNFLGWENIYLEHINRLLDFMIIADPEKRRDVDNIIILTKSVIRLIQGRYNPISKNIRQLCTYCGQGYYVIAAKDNIAVGNLGFHGAGTPDWRILACNTCGHIQIFRVDKAKEKDLWL